MYPCPPMGGKHTYLPAHSVQVRSAQKGDVATASTNALEPVQDDRIHIGLLNAPFLFKNSGKSGEIRR